jgi:hypothetical protein
VPPTQVDLPPGQGTAPATTQDDAPAADGADGAEGTAPLRLQDLAHERTDASQAEGDASPNEDGGQTEGYPSAGERAHSGEHTAAGEHADPAGQPSSQS